MIAKLETFEEDIRSGGKFYIVSKADPRYIGWFANVTFDKALRENVSKKNTSAVALELFKQVTTS